MRTTSIQKQKPCSQRHLDEKGLLWVAEIRVLKINLDSSSCIVDAGQGLKNQ